MPAPLSARLNPPPPSLAAPASGAAAAATQAFFPPLQIFGQLSAKLNPAMCLAQWIAGQLNGVDFVCLSLSELAGAFVGEWAGWVGERGGWVIALGCTAPTRPRMPSHALPHTHAHTLTTIAHMHACRRRAHVAALHASLQDAA